MEKAVKLTTTTAVILVSESQTESQEDVDGNKLLKTAKENNVVKSPKFVKLRNVLRNITLVLGKEKFYLKKKT